MAASRYPGSNQSRGVVAPGFSAKFGNGFFIDSTQGAGYRLDLPHGAFVVGGGEHDPGRADENRLDAWSAPEGHGPGSGPVLVGGAGVTLFNAAELSVTIDSPVTHVARRVGAHGSRGAG